MSWMEYLDKAIQLRERERQIRSARLGLERLQEVTREMSELVSEAAGRLPARGEVCAEIAAQLQGESERSELVFRILRHRKQFPRIYLEPLVRSSVSLRYRGVSRIEAASRAYGQRAVVTVILDIALEGGIDETMARFFMSFSKSAQWMRKEETDPDSVRALGHEVIDVIRARDRAGGGTSIGNVQGGASSPKPSSPREDV